MNNPNKSALAVETYHIDPVHSTISFKVKHMMINHSIGRFNEFSGNVHFDPHDLENSSIRITIQAASIDTYNKDRDEHLKGPDFFDATRYPTITFSSTSIARQLGHYAVSGILTIKGVTKKISLPVHIEGPVKNAKGHETIGISGEIVINRKEFGISFDQTVDDGKKPMVDDHVMIDINIESSK
jgi:polyisoprenoid-binding protein YceI